MAALLGGLLLVAGHAGASPLRVVASFSVLADFAHEIGGDLVTVRSLVGPDGDAHVYQPSPADAQSLHDAQLFIENGLGLEGWVDRLRHAADFTGRTVVGSEGIVPLAEAGAGPDPHAWQDVTNARRYARNIASGLIAADPSNADHYSAALSRYDSALADLDRRIRDDIAEIPPANRRIITAHDAFRYFGQAYGVEFQAPVGISEDSEPSAAAIASLIRQIRAERIKAVFVENMTDPRLIRQLAAEAGVTVGGTLFADALSPPGTDGDSYIAMMRHNVTAMVAAMKRN